MTLIIHWQILRTMIHYWHICIPFDISKIGIFLHQIVYYTKHEILNFRISQIQYNLRASSSQYRFTIRRLYNPVRMLFIKFAYSVCHLRLNPETKLYTMFLSISKKSVNTIRQLVLVNHPISQT